MLAFECVSSIDTLCSDGHNTLVCLSVKHGQSHQLWGGPRAAPFRAGAGSCHPDE